MNPLLSRLQPYPFERLRQLFSSVTPSSAHRPISLGIGEPRHATPQLVLDALAGATTELAAYPPTAGSAALRQACAGWVQRRYGLSLNADTQVLPVNGSREALFAFAQVVVDHTKPHATVVCPNPAPRFWQGLHPITRPATRNAISTSTGMMFPLRFGSKRNCCLCAHRVTPQARSCPWPIGKSFSP